MARMSDRPVGQALHQLIMALVRSAPLRNQSILGVYKRLLKRFGPIHIAFTQFGMTLECDVTDFVPRTIFLFGVWEPNVTDVVGALLRPGDVFVDVGTNIGYYALLGAKQVGDAGQVLAIEASPSIYQRLLRNVARNALANVRCVNLAVADRPGTLTVYRGPDYNSGVTSTLAGWRDGVVECDIPALPLNEIVAADEIGRVSLIKIDVEGAERPILEQIADTIDQYPSKTEIVVECNPEDDPEGWEGTFGKLLRAGFHAFGIENDYREIWYIKRDRRPFVPVKLDTVPREKMDILFTRRAALH